ncbi:MAG: AraC family transcriptional regulator [Ruminococcaceae bacterium]|nr:AraC family transcriptional regulator [Oscillospiraceae bacterium]
MLLSYESISDEKDFIPFGKFFHEKPIWPARGDLPYRMHGAIEFIFVLSGAVTLMNNKQTYEFQPGEVVFLNSFEPHRCWYHGPSEVYVALVSSGFFNDDNELGNISFPTHNPYNPGFDSVCRFLEYASSEWDKDSISCKRAFAEEIAYLMKKYYPYEPKKTLEKGLSSVADALRYVDGHLTKKLTQEMVAAKMGYCPAYFSGLFKDFVGVTFPDYINYRRIVEFGRLKRENPELSIGKLAQMCGFTSMNTFYRAYNKFGEETVDSAKKY